MSCRHCEQGRYIVGYAMRITMLQRQNLMLLYYLIARRA